MYGTDFSPGAQEVTALCRDVPRVLGALEMRTTSTISVEGEVIYTHIVIRPLCVEGVTILEHVKRRSRQPCLHAVRTHGGHIQ